MPDMYTFRNRRDEFNAQSARSGDLTDPTAKVVEEQVLFFRVFYSHSARRRVHLDGTG